MARVDVQALGELAVGQRLARLAEHLEHLQAQRVAERFQLLGTVQLENVERCRLLLGWRHGDSLDDAAPSRKTCDADRRQAGEAGRNVSA